MRRPLLLAAAPSFRKPSTRSSPMTAATLLSRACQVQYVVGRRRFSVSSHTDYESADRDHRLAKSLFNLLGGESFIKLHGRPGKRVIFNDPATLREGDRTIRMAGRISLPAQIEDRGRFD